MRLIEGKERNPKANIIVPTVVSLTPADLPVILKKSFAVVFATGHIKKSSTSVGLVPFTQKVLTNNKLRQELGQSDPNTKIENLALEYEEVKNKLKEEDFNKCAFDTKIPRAFKIQRKKTKKSR